MNKTQLRKFAAVARKKIEDAVRQKAYSFGITKDEIKPLQELSDGLIINGTVMGEREQKQYNHLKNRIQLEGYETVMDEAAYTWFNRFVAMRYMEVNDFLPIHMRILSSKNPDKREPDALTEILSLVDDLDLNRERVYQMKENSQLNELYQYLLIKQSIKLGDILPNVFDPITDDLALLLPDNLLNENSIIRDIVTMVDEQDWTEVEIVGWLYQFYIADEKDEVFANLKKKKKIGKKEIGPATQLFTPRWIVEYMVDNSLGRLWLESHPDETIQSSLNYYLEDAEQPESVKAQLETLKDPTMDIEDVSFLDPSCGSGHILVYAFDVFYTIYLSRGYRERDIPRLILENNLYGLDIDKRAAQLATFALIMKAREYDRRLFSRNSSVNIHSIEETNTITDSQIDLFAKNNSEIKKEIAALVETFIDAKLYGSILKMPEINIELIREQLDYIRNEAEIDLLTTELIEYAFPLIEDMIEQYLVLSKKYDVVVTNPPYMGSKGMNADLKKYLKKEYPEEKRDLYAVFMDVTRIFTKKNGFIGMINQQTWMFISSFDKLRNKLVKDQTIVNMLHLGTRTFEEIGGEVVQNTSYVIRKIPIKDYIGTYVRMVDIKNAQEKRNNFFNKELYHTTTQLNFIKIPGSPIAYWISEKFYELFEKDKLSDYVDIKQGAATSDNERFLRFWNEINYSKIGFNLSKNEAIKSSYKWFPYNKGGASSKWYGNNDYLVNFEDNGKEMKEFHQVLNKNHPGGRLKNQQYYFKEGFTWSTLSNELAVRYCERGFIFDTKGSMGFVNQNISVNYFMAFLNSIVSREIANILAPTLDLNPIALKNFPIIIRKEKLVKNITKKAVLGAKQDWDSFETSWDFEEHPFLTYKEDSSLIEDSFNKWSDVAEECFYQLKENEEELNRIFIDIYGLQDELTPEVAEKDVTVNKAKLDRDVKSFLSYLVGVMFGRYSLDKKGLAYAGGEWDESHYTSYKPDDTNIIPLTEDQYFEDDIMNKIEELVSLIYGKETLEENLRFIAEALKMKSNESARDRIRRYFMKEFYKDHLKTYQKRPIYWQFTSGKRGAFKGLMYLHRYHKYTVAQLRTEYILHQATVLDNLISHEQQVIADETSSATQKARAQKTIDEYTKDRAELAKYDQVIEHVARKQVELDLDDGVKENYQLFQNIEVTDDTSNKPKKQNVFEKI
ncbi:Methyltransferase domain-containing protein [Alkalibacterium putridalgicola]|uniref:site-specific DNA-methyltransferase (adenine-specific) n=1 Tax=Alkalibacterium putridalgicola TaxID=426703 RepID=A0A1H7SA49_9LACT|nr:BREX-1 system adenine-specific DNA-methyltransferase PglX [Alkalibacterium putridalgicola]GEK89126.1 class I SAM-dependent DNA methyltransferase [Alkalibacterium putridalgicola]SEL69490.1 Methyltransferase domain-containing protein [Alkalibacterium putridalgicola]